jgi:hypothetical protein
MWHVATMDMKNNSYRILVENLFEDCGYGRMTLRRILGRQVVRM